MLKFLKRTAEMLYLSGRALPDRFLGHNVVCSDFETLIERENDFRPVDYIAKGFNIWIGQYLGNYFIEKMTGRGMQICMADYFM